MPRRKSSAKGTRARKASGRKASGKQGAQERQEALRKELIRRREAIVREAKEEVAKYIRGENRQLVETALDDGDWSVVDLSDDVIFRKLSVHKETLNKIDTALRKLQEGTYGICEDCGEEISLERLKVMPFAILCRDCQERQEALEALEREEGPPT
jgi:DnaK suppressor protein